MSEFQSIGISVSEGSIPTYRHQMQERGRDESSTRPIAESKAYQQASISNLSIYCIINNFHLQKTYMYSCGTLSQKTCLKYSLLTHLHCPLLAQG